MYIDPSAGSLVLQIVAAGVISAAAVAGRFRRGVKAFVRTIFTRRPN